MKDSIKGKGKKKGKPSSKLNGRGNTLGGLEGQTSARAAPAAKLSSKLLDMKEREQKETAKIKKIEDSSKWSLKTVFPSRQLVKAAEPALGYSEINGAAVQGRRGFGEFAKKDAEKEEIDNSDKRDNEQDINSSQNKKPLKKRKANEKGARGFKGISNLFN